VDLSGGLSNRSLGDLLQSLTGSSSVQARRRVEPTRAGWPDGRRKFGSVSRAIVDALSANGDEMSVKVIREQVEAKLGGHVSRFSVSDYLLTRSKGANALFERTRHGHYRLMR
jgi:hypothetical protein